MKPAPSVALFLVEDHPVVAEGLALLLEGAGHRVVGRAASLAEAQALLPSVAPDVVLVDLCLGDEETGGLDLIRAMPALRPDASCLVYSMYEESRLIKAALQAGARGYVTKQELARDLLTAVGEVAAGRVFVGPRASASLAQSFQPQEQSSSDAPKGLSEREEEVYRLLGSGLGQKQIAQELALSPRTVECYYRRLQDKLDVHGGMSELRQRAVEAARRT